MGLLHWLTLAMTDGLGPITIKRLVEAAGNAEGAARLNRAELEQIEGVGTNKARTIRQSLDAAGARAEAELRKCAEIGVTVLCPDDPKYPPLLRTIHDPPPVLYMKGSIEDRDLNALAIVGSRRCSHYGREQADRFAALLAGAGFTVVSGGARGVDSAAHRGALQHPHGRTIAVFGCGIDVVYPRENESLFSQIAARGAVLSEFALGTQPSPENFPRRNRIVSGLSRGVLVVEGDEHSGAMITARLAGEDQGRVVLALPGRVDNIMSNGPHKLIRDGAVLVTGLEDIFEALGPLPHEVTQPSLFEQQTPTADPAPMQTTARADGDHAASGPVSARQQSILAQLDEEPLGAEQIMQRTGLEAPAVLQELTYLSLRGMVKRVDGQTYARARGAGAAAISGGDARRSPAHKPGR